MFFMQLIDEIQGRPELWDLNDPRFRIKFHRCKAWKEVREKFRVDEMVLKKRWKHLKDQYRKELKKSTDTTGSSWQYFDRMHFLKDQLLKEPADNSNSDHPTSSRPQTAIEDLLRKLERKVSVIERQTKKTEHEMRNDEDYHFLMSLLPTIQQLNRIQKLQFRNKVNECLIEMMQVREYEGPPISVFVKEEPNLKYEEPIIE